MYEFSYIRSILYGNDVEPNKIHSKPNEINEDEFEEEFVKHEETCLDWDDMFSDEEEDEVVQIPPPTSPKPSYYLPLQQGSPEQPRRLRVWSNSTTDSECEITLIDIEYHSTDDELDQNDTKQSDHTPSVIVPIHEDDIVASKVQPVELSLDLSEFEDVDEKPQQPKTSLMGYLDEVSDSNVAE